MARLMGAEPLVWRARGVEWEGRRTLVMGVLNVTPDSFSDGGRFHDEREAVGRGLQIAEEGADLLDVGGESTRPGSQSVPAEEGGRGGGGGAAMGTAAAGRRAPAMAKLVAESGAGAVIMHMRGEPATMQADPRYADVVAEVTAFLAQQLESAVAAGGPPAANVLDPGSGFGKTPAHNEDLLRGLPGIRGLGRPVLVGVSRKSFLATVHPKGDTRRLGAALPAAGLAIRQGADIVRVHDVVETVRYVRMLDGLLGRG